ncbi:hypothetical protein BUALT_Bualt11G0081600 [Buddleja alternifolia]|uniref:CCT domain-containing protein n=1 Tax=Buddleja alternifolia TaxID=168488 RepID=A0AAV6WTT4_9LAMI|nr:hypothetical protein BUALT_Bualt11G0081600 [Buddleja alternifolia]
MSSCLSGGGRAYRLDIDIIKSPINSWISNSSSPSSTLSESSNSPLRISTRKTRTPRKRPNQTYNEAAAILSTAYPKIFPKNPCKFTKSHKCTFPFEPSELLMPSILEKRNVPPKGFNREIVSSGNSNSTENFDEFGDDFDAESILDEEIEEGIDSIMGNLSMENNESIQDFNPYACYGYPVGLGFDVGNGMRKESKAMRNVDEGDWWRFPSVNVVDITRKVAKISVEKKMKKKVEKKSSELSKGNSFSTIEPNYKDSLGSKGSSEESISQTNGGMLLKLNYDDVLEAWADRSSPFSGDGPVAESAGNGVQARLAQIDLFSKDGGATEAVVLRHKDKRRTRVISKKIRYQVRKVNHDQRPRMKGGVSKTPNSIDDEQE